MIIYVKCKANSSKQEIEKLDNGGYLVYLKSEPEKNKANIELINSLSKYFHIPSPHIKIKSGLTSREKILEIK